MSKKEYWVGDNLYTVDDEHEEEFLQNHENAKLKEEDTDDYTVGEDGQRYTVNKNDKEEFLEKYPEAKLLSGNQSSSTESATVGQSTQARKNQYDDSEFATEGILSESQLNLNSLSDHNIDFGPMPEITTDITGVSEEKAQKLLQDKWMEHGFTFEQKTVGLNRIEVTALNGEKEIFNLGGFKGTQEEEAKRMDAWMRERAQHQGDKLQTLLSHVNVTQDQTSTIRPTQDNAQDQINKLREAWELEGMSDEDVLEVYNKYMDNNRKFVQYDMDEGYGPGASQWVDDMHKKQDQLEKAGFNKSGRDFKKNIDNLNTLVEGRKDYRKQEALKKYEAQTGVSIDGMYDDDGITDKGIKILNSQEYKNIYNSLKVDKDKQQKHLDKYFLNSKTQDFLEANLKKEIEKFSNNPFVKSSTQKELLELAIDKKNAMSDKLTEKVNKFNVAHGDLENIYTELSDAAKWLNSIGNGEEKLEEIKAKHDLTTEEGVRAAQAELNLFQAQYQEKRDRFDFLQKKRGQYEKFANNIAKDLNSKDALTEGQITTVIDALNRNYQQGTVMSVQLMNATIDLAQGIGEAGDMILSIPKEIVKAIDNPAVDGYIQANPGVNSNTSNKEKENWWSELNASIDDWQKGTQLLIEKPTKFNEINSLSSFGEWVSGMAAGQVPILATMAVSGGASLYIMGASSAGSKWREMNDAKDEYNRTGGLYGTNHAWGTMFANSVFTGTAEALSERITLGQVNRMKGILGFGDVAKLGFEKTLRQSVFQTARLAATDRLTEGVSESVAQLSSNFADVVSGSKSYADIWEGIPESFVSGVIISQGLATPGLGKALSAPFRSADTNQRVGEMSKKINELTKRAGRFDIDSKERKAIEAEIAGLVDKSNSLIEQDIKRVNLLTDGEKKALINIEKQNYEARKKAEDIMLDKKLTDKEKKQQLADLQAKVDMRAKTKNDIIGKYEPNVVDANYEREMDWFKRQAELSNQRGDIKTKVREVSRDEFIDLNAKQEGEKSKAAVDDAIMQKQGEIEGLLNVLRSPRRKNQSVEQYNETKKDASRLLKQARSQESQMMSVLAQGNDYGMMIPKIKNGNLVGMDVVINRNAALTDGQLNTGAHEFLHAQFANTLKGDPGARSVLGQQMNKIINTGKMRFKNPSAKAEYANRISMYEKDKRGEEQFTILSEMMRDGKVSINEGTTQKFKDFFRRFSRNYNNRPIAFNETQDVLDFIKDFDYNIRKNKLSPAMAEMLQKGANGRMFEDVKDSKTRDQMKSFNRAVDLNRRQNPDLKREYDQFVQNSDGTRKYEDHKMFTDSPDYYGAYLNIVEGRALDGLIQHGMTERGLPPEALREFTRMAKEEVGRRFLENYDYDKNDSLFGWLTGVSGGAGMSIIYRAKGDVMVKYKKDNKAELTSIDKPVSDDGARLSDVIQDERDILLEEIDNQDLSLNRRREAKQAVRDLKVKEMLNFSDNARKAIILNIREMDIPLDGLTYKGVKDLLISVDKKATSEKKITPNGPLFPVLNAVATEFGVDPLRILAKQDLNGEQREAAQSYILDKTTNEDGSFNTDLLDMLPEGETRSGEATGIANTKLGQLYQTGARLKVAEGADKALGQKKAQIKRSNISKAEFLDIFGIEPNGKLRKGTKADGAIRALVVATAQIAANQDMRINALTNGTTNEAVAAKLGDGRSEVMLSKKIKAENLDVFQDRWAEAISGLDSINVHDWKSIKGHLVNVYGDVMENNELTGMAKDWAKWSQEFDELKLPDNFENVNHLDYYNRETYVISKTNEALLDTSILKMFAGNFVSPVKSVTELFNSRDRVNKARGSIVDFGNHAIENLKWKPEKLIRTLFTQYQGMYAGAYRIGDGRWTVKKGRVVAAPLPEGQTKHGTNRGQVFTGIEDFISTLSKINGFKNIKGKSRKQIGEMFNVDLKTFSETSDAAIKDQDYEGRLNQAKEAREAVQDLVDFYVDRIYNGEAQFEDLAMLTRMFGSNMKSPMKRAANLAYIAKGASSIPSDQRGKKLEYEHMVPTNLKILQLVDSYVNQRGVVDGFWDDYTVAVIPKTMDRVLIDSGLRDFMQLGYQPGMASWKRYYNNQTFGKKGIVPIKNIQTGEIVGQEFVKASDKFVVNKNAQTVIQNTRAEVMKSKWGWKKKKPEIRGMSAFDFDETLIIDGDNFIMANNPETGETERISSEDWPTRGTELMDQGWEFDFDDFINVRGGVEGPLFQKLLNRIEKYGPENNFILTARPQESAIAIHGWLKSKGVEIPLENITGLGDSKGDSKAAWILEKYKEGYNDMYFVDDALPNVKAVKHVMDQLDVKGSSVQVGVRKIGGLLVDTNTPEGKKIWEEIKNIPTVRSSTTNSVKKFGRWLLDTATPEGKAILKEFESIPTVSSSEPGRVVKRDSDAMKSKSLKERIIDTQSIDKDFNDMLARTSFVGADRVISKSEAQRLGIGKGRYDWFVPPSAEDMKGLFYRFLGKGEQGNADMKWYREFLSDPYAKGIKAWTNYVQGMANDYTALRKAMPNAAKVLKQNLPNSPFTGDAAIRVYLWNKNGIEIPGSSPQQVQQMVEFVEADPDLVGFAEALSRVSKRPEGYVQPTENWAVQSIAYDLKEAGYTLGRKDFLHEWVENKNIIFSDKNLNKIEAIYGKPTRTALENMLHRMETGVNRPTGRDGATNRFLNWINGSVGAVMFFNMRSALLQTISTVNFINWEDNNIFRAAQAFANQPQFWSDFAMIFNSDMLKQRRSGLQIDVNANELSNAFRDGRSKPEAVIRWLLEKGFMPTQIADSFAIAMGGSSFYRNRLNDYIREGATPEQAQNQAWLDFQEIAEETQQSSRPDLISEQQAGVLGRLILAWQNTPMQMTRLTKKALSDLANGRGSAKANISRIMYYGFIQNIIFGILQSGLAFIAFGDEEEEKKKKTERVLNGAFDTLLRGTGVGGAVVATLKNTILKFIEQRKKGWTGDQTYTIIEAINLSPPLGSKFRKIYNAIQTDKFNKGVSEKLKYRIENPFLSIVGNVVEALTNFPMARLINKANNIEEAITGNHDLWQRIAMLGGWNRWTVGAEDEELEEAKQEVKDEKAEKKKIEKEIKKEEEKKKKEEEKKAEEEKKKKDGIKQVRCSATKSNGQRCNMMVETKNKTAKCVYHRDLTDEEKKEGTDRDNDGIKEFRCTATKKNGQRCKNRTENKNKKCYAHQ